MKQEITGAEGFLSEKKSKKQFEEQAVSEGLLAVEEASVEVTEKFGELVHEVRDMGKKKLEGLRNKLLFPY